MTETKKVLLIGLDPTVVDYEKWPALNPEKLEKMLRADEASLNHLGFDTRISFVDHGETAGATVTKALAETRFDCILIGAGVRNDPAEFTLFETLINIVHRHAHDARICFNTGPTDSVAAVRRWI